MFFNINVFFCTCFPFFKHFYGYSFVSILSSYRDIIYFVLTLLGFSVIFCRKNLDFLYIKPGQNSSLLNYMAFYHPVLLYVYIINFIYLILEGQRFFFKRNYMFFKNQITVVVSFLLSLLWSSQEIFWNGFWNWDMVEISLFNFIVVSLFVSHSKHKYRNCYNSFNIYLVVFFFFFISNKTNLIFSQHSFSSFYVFKIPGVFFISILFYFFFKIIRSVLFFGNKHISFYFLSYYIIFLYYIFYKYSYSTKPSDVFFKVYIHSIFYFFSLKNLSILLFFNSDFYFFSTLWVTLKKKKKITNITHYVIYLFVVLSFIFFLSFNYQINYDTVSNQIVLLYDNWVSKYSIISIKKKILVFFCSWYYGSSAYVFRIKDLFYFYSNSCGVYCF